MEMGLALDEQENKMWNANKILGGIAIERSVGKRQGGREAGFNPNWEDLPSQISGEPGSGPATGHVCQKCQSRANILGRNQ